MITYADLAAVFPGPILLHPLEVEALSALAANARLVVDIGTGHGASAVLFALSVPVYGAVHTADPFQPGQGEGTSVATYEHARVNILQAANAGHLSGYVIQHVMASTDLAGQWDERLPIALVFIDGDHRYEAVRADVDAWLPHVRSGGMLALHDSRVPDEPGDMGKGMPGPMRVAAELDADPRVRRYGSAHSITAWEVV